MNLNYKSYWRKTGLKGKWGNIFLERLSIHNPKNFLEIGVFCGVTARNICDFLNKINGKNFNYIGIDLFGGDKNTAIDEIEPKFLINQKFSNPLTWLDTMLNGVEHMNFFEGRATEYSKASTRGTWGEVFA